MLAGAQTPSPSPKPSPSPSASVSPSPTPNIPAMIARLRAAQVANKPFTIWLNDGTKIPVAGSSYIALHPPSEGMTNIVVFTETDTENMIPINQITNLTTP